MAQDPRYKIYSPTWMRIEELGARGLSLSMVKDAYSYGLLTSYATHGLYLTKVQNLNFADKESGDNAADSTYETRTSNFQYGRSRPGVGDRMLETWDVHGIFEEFCTALGMTLPIGQDAYLNAKTQFEWFKVEMAVPDIEYGDILRLAEVWLMGVSSDEVRGALDTYKNSADLTCEPPITSYDINIIKSLYEREKQGWIAHAQKTGHLAWTLVPECMGDYITFMTGAPFVGDPEDHVFKRNGVEAVAARAAYRPRARPFAALGGMGSPTPTRRRRIQ